MTSTLTKLFALIFCGASIAASTLRIGNGAEPRDLDPQTAVGTAEARLIQNLFEGLVSKDPVTLKIVPGVAESWKRSKDNKSYTFKLRKNAKWSDGTPVTAQDFVYSWTRLLTPATGSEYAYQGYYFKNGKAFYNRTVKDVGEVGFKAKDALTLEITLENPTPFFLDLLFHISLYPVPKSAIEKFGARWTRAGNLVSNGAYQLEKWDLNRWIVVKKNPNYWNKEGVQIDIATFFPIDNADTEEKMFRANDLDITATVPLEKIPRWQTDKTGAYQQGPYLSEYYYKLNVTKPPLNNKLVRRALALSIDREKLVKYVLKSGQVPATSITPPGTGGYVPTPRMPSGPEEFDKARKLLADAGFPGGKNFPLVEILYNTSEGHKKIAEAVQQMWKSNLGISVRLVNQEWKVYQDSMKALNFQIGRFAWTADYNDPNTFLDNYVTNGGNNQTGWSNPAFDALVEKSAKEMDTKKRFESLHKAEDLLLEEAPIIPVYVYTRGYLRNPKIQGWSPNLEDIHFIKDVRWETPPTKETH